MRSIAWTVAAFLIGLVPVSVSAQVPALMPVQGYLTDSAGVAVDGETSITFALYSVDMAGTPLFTETQTVLVEDGFFTAYIGDVGTLDLTVFRDNAAVYLGIQVGGDPEMTPRLQMATVPYAAVAQHALSAPALECVTESMSASHTSFFSMTVSCPAGYVVTGGGHDWSIGGDNVWFWQSSVSGETSYLCRGSVNRAGAASTITCFARCCR